MSRCSFARKSRWRSRRFGKWCRSAGSWFLHPIRFPTPPTNTTTTVNAVTLPSGESDATSHIGRNITHHFSFGERFDETMMKCYFVCYQHIMLPNNQFIEFSPLNKSAGEVTVVNITIRRLLETKSPPLDFPFASERSSKLSFELPKGLRVIPNSGLCFSMVASLCFGLPKTACYPSRWLKRHFICALILLKLACVMPK